MPKHPSVPDDTPLDSNATKAQPTDSPMPKVKNKKGLLNKLVVARRQYDKAIAAYKIARREYAKAKLEERPQEKLGLVQKAYQKAAESKARRKEKFEDLERVVQYYFSNRSRQLG